jgi:type II secretion system protein H
MRATRRIHRRQAAGFTLIEMLVVLAILALAVGIGLPSLANLVPQQRLNGTAEALSAELGLLRAEALRTGRFTALVFDPAGNVFLSSRSGATPLSVASLRVSVEIDSTSRAAPGEIRFLPSGGSTGGRIRLTGPSGSRLFDISRVTGSVHRAADLP